MLPAVPATHPRQAACRVERAETASARNGARQTSGSPGTSYPGVPSAYESTNSAPVRRIAAGPRRLTGSASGLPRRRSGGTAPAPSCASGAPARRRPHGRTPRGAGCRGGRRRRRAPPGPPSIPRFRRGRWARIRRCPPPRPRPAREARPPPGRRGRSWGGPARGNPGSSARSRRPPPRGPERRPLSPKGAKAPRGRTPSAGAPETARGAGPGERSPSAGAQASSGAALPCDGVVDPAMGDRGEDLADRPADGVQVAQREVALVQLAVEVDPVDDPGHGPVHLLRRGAVEAPDRRLGRVGQHDDRRLAGLRLRSRVPEHLLRRLPVLHHRVRLVEEVVQKARSVVLADDLRDPIPQAELL